MARILDATEGILSTDAASAASLLQCGVEYMEVGDEAVVDRWIEFCEYLDRRGLNVLSQFSTGTIDSTRTLVRLALKDSENSRTICLAAINASRLIADRSIPAAAYCYQQSPILLAQLSVDSFEEWVRFGLENCADSNRLRAYFNAQSKISSELIKNAPGILRLETIEPVLSAYVQMLTGREIPIVEKEFEWDLHEPAQDGSTIQLPEKLSGLQSSNECFKYYKATAALQAGYFEFGSFDRDTGPLIEIRHDVIKCFPRLEDREPIESVDARKMLDLFPQADLVRRLFAIVENARVEYKLRRTYRGLGEVLDLAKGRRRQARPGGEYVLGFEPMLEVLYLDTIGAGLGDLPLEEDDETSWLGRIRFELSETIRKDEATVADSVRACLNLYLYLSPEQVGDNNDLEVEEETSEFQPQEFEDQGPRPQCDPKREDQGTPERPDPTKKAFDELDEGQLSNAFYYDEWDNRINDYRPRWCRVLETEWDRSDSAFVRNTLQEYKGLLARTRDQFQRMRPVGLRRLRSQIDGDEIDLEAMTDYFIDRRSHKNPSDKIYSQRRRDERNVAVCFLLDMSGSTSSVTGGRKRILNIEKEALLLMSEALEAIGDPYSIYGFSGKGKDQVDFYRFKDFDEDYDDKVRGRIGAAHWLINTRLGAAIRHASWRLNQQPSVTRLLILLSDARPKDDGYPDGAEDTKAALAESRASGVIPFCITFNPGIYEEEFEQIFEGVGYTIIDDVVTLPERLPGIYRRLTN